MKESVLHNVVRCSKCGEHYYKYRGVSDTRCESCYEDSDIPREEKQEATHEDTAKAGS